MIRLAVLTVLFAALSPSMAQAVHIRELCDVKGVRDNQLIGYGLVVGLNGTGDSPQARFTMQSVAAMLRRLGPSVDPMQIQIKNVAAVMVTATLPPFANPGQEIDVTVSSMGNAKSLLGGTLLQTPLKGANRQVYAVAQGPLLIGGFSASGGSGSSVTQNHVTVGRIPAGAIVERRVAGMKLSSDNIVLTLRSPSFITARRIVAAINSRFGANTASARDSATIRVESPTSFAADPVGFLAEVQLLQVDADMPVRVVVDERTGTVVLGAGVEIAEVAVAQGGLTVEILEQPGVSQPNAFGGGDTKVVPNTKVRASLAEGALTRVSATASLSEVIGALNALGARPRDLVAIFQALRSAGALRAQIEVQ